eukprot:GHVU01057399.1.p3 GENE.GHVU01057399.1~~GHVU01057399.1.p3  ORF type:complete len:138 (+),score=12.51 GHVU01057399.1:364-777(+)
MSDACLGLLEHKHLRVRVDVCVCVRFCACMHACARLRACIVCVYPCMGCMRCLPRCLLSNNCTMQLSKLQIAESSFRFGYLTMESDKWICIKDTSGDGNFLVLIDMCGNCSVSRKPMRADGAVMNPVKHVFALKGAN